MGHVWTAPAVQEESDVLRSVRVQPCRSGSWRWRLPRWRASPGRCWPRAAPIGRHERRPIGCRLHDKGGRRACRHYGIKFRSSEFRCNLPEAIWVSISIPAFEIQVVAFDITRLRKPSINERSRSVRNSLRENAIKPTRTGLFWGCAMLTFGHVQIKIERASKTRKPTRLLIFINYLNRASGVQAGR